MSDTGYADGRCRFGPEVIQVRPGLSPADRAAVLTHELAHVVAHGPGAVRARHGPGEPALPQGLGRRRRRRAQLRARRRRPDRPPAPRPRPRHPHRRRPCLALHAGAAPPRRSPASRCFHVYPMNAQTPTPDLFATVHTVPPRPGSPSPSSASGSSASGATRRPPSARRPRPLASAASSSPGTTARCSSPSRCPRPPPSSVPRLPRRDRRRVGREPARGVPVLPPLQRPVRPRRPQPPQRERRAVEGRRDRVETTEGGRRRRRGPTRRLRRVRVRWDIHIAGRARFAVEEGALSPPLRCSGREPRHSPSEPT